MTGSALIDPKIEIFDKILIAPNNIKFHHSDSKNN